MKRNFNLAQHAFIAQDPGPNCWLVEPMYYNPNGKKEEKQQVIINYGFVLVFKYQWRSHGSPGLPNSGRKMRKN